MVTMDKIQWLFPELEENYQYLHQHPELGFEEQITSAFIAQKLDEYGIPYRRVARTGSLQILQENIPEEQWQSVQTWMLCRFRSNATSPMHRNVPGKCMPAVTMPMLLCC